MRIGQKQDTTDHKRDWRCQTAKEQKMDGGRNTLGLMMVTTILIGLGFLLMQAGTPTAKASDAAITPLRWMGGCYPPVMAVGRYFPGDAPCRPSRTISLRQLETALAANDVLKAGESLQFASQAQARALKCWALVMDGSTATGWVCSDGGGLYRVGMDGGLASGRWQLLADGTWAAVDL